MVSRLACFVYEPPNDISSSEAKFLIVEYMTGMCIGHLVAIKPSL
jgi:hypothetical protein